MNSWMAGPMAVTTKVYVSPRATATVDGVNV